MLIKILLVVLILFPIALVTLDSCVADPKSPRPSLGLAATSLDPDMGPLAIIEYQPNRIQKVIAMGEEVAPGYYLVDVTASKITVAHDGREITLRLGENLSASPTASSPQQGKPAHAALAQIATKRWNTLEHVISTVISNGRRIVQQGPYQGALYLSHHPWGVLYSVGLKRHDYITEINGKKPSDLTPAEIANMFERNTKMRFTVARDGQSQTLDYDPTTY